MRRHLKKLVNIIAISLFTLYCLIWLLSPIIANYVINNHGLPKGYSVASSSNIRYNPFMAHLSVSDLEIQLEGHGKILQLNSLDAEVHLHRLLFDSLYIAQFDVDGITIPIVAEEKSLTVAGFELINEVKAKTDPETVASSALDTQQDETESSYKLVIPKFNLTNAVIELKHLTKSHRIELDALSLDDLLLSQQEQGLHLLLSSRINQAPLKLSVKTKLIEQKGIINVELDVDKFGLNHVQALMPETLKALNGQLSYSSKLSIELMTDKTLVNFDELLLSLNDFHVEQNNLSIDIANQQVASSDLSVALTADSEVNVATNVTANITAISVKTLNDDQLINIEDIAIENVLLKFSENKPNIAISNVTVNDALFSQDSIKKNPALASFKQLSVNDIGYQTDSVSIQDITLSGLVANLLLNENKQLVTLISLDDKALTDADSDSAVSVQSNDEMAVDSDSASEPTKKLNFSLGEFKLLDDAEIDFKDSSVKPHYQRNVQINTLTLTNINTAQTESESLFSLIGKSDKYANFTVNGRGQPFAIKQNYNVEAVIKEVSLPGVSSYIKDALKYEIESGQLDVKLTAGLDGSEINGDVDLLLRGVEFTAADDHESGTITDQTSVPFNIALGMLKDSDGNVELSVPLSGDTSSPSFGFSGFLTLLVKQATMSAAKEYLITTFVPYASVMKVAMAAGEFALKLRINDMNYLAGQTELSAEQIEFSRQMSVMLKDKADINVKLCAIATPADIGVTSAEQAHLEDNIQRLKVISQQRVEIFKDYMVEQLKVTSAKLLLCTPQIDSSKEAKSRIEFVI
jgi:hypothetical protein